MDFGKILDSWEKKEAAKGSGAKDSSAKMNRTLDRYPPEAMKDEKPQPGEPAAERRRRLKRMAPQDELDLHGIRAADVESIVGRFLRQAHSRGLEKLLLIHGKGTHSTGEPVLRRAVVRVLEKSPIAGEYGEAPRNLGGGGALWVILRQRSR